MPRGQGGPIMWVLHLTDEQLFVKAFHVLDKSNKEQK